MVLLRGAITEWAPRLNAKSAVAEIRDAFACLSLPCLPCSASEPLPLNLRCLS